MLVSCTPRKDGIDLWRLLVIRRPNHGQSVSQSVASALAARLSAPTTLLLPNVWANRWIGRVGTFVRTNWRFW